MTEDEMAVHEACTADALRIDDDEPEVEPVTEKRIQLKISVDICIRGVDT